MPEVLAQTDRAPQPEGGKKPKNQQEFLIQAVKRFDRAATAETMNRQMAVDDLKFKNGEQWPPDIKAQRTIEKRPCLTINKCKTFVHQVTNDQRQNRPGINVSPVGDGSDKNTAKMLKGLIRQIERQSNADVAYDTGFDGAVSNGFGYWRIISEFEDGFDQCLRIARIRNPMRVYMDPDTQEPDASDQNWSFISDLITREEYRDTYKGKEPLSFEEAGLGDAFRYWTTQTHVRIAEYFWIETIKRRLLALENGHTGFYDELAPDVRKEVDSVKSFVRKERDVQGRKIHWDTISGNDVIDEKIWAGKWIPLVRVIGDEVDVEGKVTYSGLIRDAKDPQRMYNYWCTLETEMVALMPKAPWIMEEGQVEGHEKQWKEANLKSVPYLLYKGTSITGKPAPAPQRQQFQGPPTAIVQAKIAAAQDMQATTGIRFDATQQERMYDESGKALRELKRVGDLGNFHYVDNLARSLRHTGRILIDAIPKYYDTRRVITILREDDSEEQVTLDPNLGVSHQTKPGANGQVEKLYNPNVGKYDVAVTIGPTFATKRAEAADSMINFLKVLPNSAPLIGDLIAKNMDWPGAEEIATRLASMLPPQALEKAMDDLPPEGKAMVQSLTTQMKQLQQERDKAIALLGDKEADRQIDRDKNAISADKVNKDFEAKLTDIVAKMSETLMGNVRSETDALTQSVNELKQGLEAQQQAQQAEQKAQSQSSSRDDKLGEVLSKQGDVHKQSLDAIAKAMEKVAEQKQPAAPTKRKLRIKSSSGKTYDIEDM